MNKNSWLTNGLKVLVGALALMGATSVWADVWFGNNNSTTWNLGSETQINSADRFILKAGTCNVNDGASLKLGGNSTSSCNYIGVDPANTSCRATLNINGGTFWCAAANNKGNGGWMAVAINCAMTASVNVNGGTLKVDNGIRFGTYWSNDTGKGGTGSLTVNAGTAEFGSVQLGTTAGSSSSGLYLKGGLLKVGVVRQRGYGTQLFQMEGGKLQATAANIFTSWRDVLVSGTRTLEVKSGCTTFNTAGFAQKIPAFTGTGTLFLTGGGELTFETNSVPYGIIASNTVFNLTGTALSTETPAFTVGGSTGFEVRGPLTLKVTLPAEANGCYSLITNVVFSETVNWQNQITVVGGGTGKLLFKDHQLLLDCTGTETRDWLEYDAAAGGEVTPDKTAYEALAFASTAGDYVVTNESALTFTWGLADLATAGRQSVAAPVTLSTANTPIYVAAGGTLALTGGLTGTMPTKTGQGTLVLDPAKSTGLTGLRLQEGTVDFNGGIFAKSFAFSDGAHTHGSTVVLTNGTWNPSAGRWDFEDYTITLKDGFTLDMTGNADLRVGLGYGAWQTYDERVQADGLTRMVVDGGQVLSKGNNSNNANFIGVDHNGTSELEVKSGQFCVTNRSDGVITALRIGAGSNAKTRGKVTVSGGELKVLGDVMLASQFNSAAGGAGTATFEQTGGETTLQYFYLGNSSAGSGSGTVSLTGGEMTCQFLNLLPYSQQTLTVNDFTFHAMGNDHGTYPFLYRTAPLDQTAKTYTLGADGVTIDNAGYTVTFAIPFAGEGAVRMTGAGVTKLAGDLPATGGIDVAAGCTIAIVAAAQVPGGIRLADGAAVQVLVEDDGTLVAPLTGLDISTPASGRATLSIQSAVYAKGILAESLPAGFDLEQVEVVSANPAFRAVASTNAQGQLTFAVAPKDASTWSGATGGSWSADGNWEAGIAPIEGHTLLFGEATTTTMVNDLGADWSFTALSFLDNAPDYALSGQAFSLTNELAVTLAGTNAVTITAPVTFSAAAPRVQIVQEAGEFAVGKLTVTKLEKNGAGTFSVGDATALGPVTLNDGTLRFTDPERFTTSTISSTGSLETNPVIDFGGAEVAAGQLGLGGPVGAGVTLRNGNWQGGANSFALGTMTLVFGEGMSYQTTGRFVSGWNSGNGTLVLNPGAGTVKFGGDSAGLCNFISVDSGNETTVDVRGGLLHFSSENGSGGYLRLAAAGWKQGPKGRLFVSAGEVRADKQIALVSAYNGTGNSNTQNGTATVVVGGTGLITTPLLSLGIDGGSLRPTANLAVTNGGVLAVGELRCHAQVTANCDFNGGTIRATKDNANWLANNAGGVHTYMLGESGITLDTAGHDVGANLAFAAASTGDITLVGGGSFTFNSGFALPAARTFNVGSTGVLALSKEQPPSITGRVAFESGAAVKLPNGNYVGELVKVLSATTITGKPSKVLINDKEYAGIWRVVNNDNGGQDLLFRLGGLVIYFK